MAFVEQSYDSITIKILLDQSQHVMIEIAPESTILDLKQELYQIRPHLFSSGLQSGSFRLKDYETYFQDQEKVSRAAKLAKAFSLNPYSSQRELLFRREEQMYDKYTRNNNRADAHMQPHHLGMLHKSSGGRRNWQKRYVVYQNCTLFWYEKEKSFQTGQQAKQYLELGGIVPKTESAEIKKANKQNCFALDVPDSFPCHGKGDKKKSVYIFAASSPGELDCWLSAIKEGIYKRQVSTMLMLLPILYNEEILKVVGIFRLAGDSGVIEGYESLISRSEYPDWRKEIWNTRGQLNTNNLHCVIDVMKRSIRFMREPPVPWSKYKQFINVDFSKTDEERISKLRNLVEQLPTLNRVLLEELFLFLNYASKFSDTSKMTTKNLAVVFAPNVLAPQDFMDPSCISDIETKLRVVTLWIKHAPEIFPSEHISSSSKPVASPFPAPPGSHGEIHPPRPPSSTLPTNNFSGVPPPSLSSVMGVLNSPATPDLQPPPSLSSSYSGQKYNFGNQSPEDVSGAPAKLSTNYDDDELVPAYSGRASAVAPPPQPIPTFGSSMSERKSHFPTVHQNKKSGLPTPTRKAAQTVYARSPPPRPPTINSSASFQKKMPYSSSFSAAPPSNLNKNVHSALNKKKEREAHMKAFRPSLETIELSDPPGGGRGIPKKSRRQTQSQRTGLPTRNKNVGLPSRNKAVAMATTPNKKIKPISIPSAFQKAAANFAPKKAAVPPHQPHSPASLGRPARPTRPPRPSHPPPYPRKRMKSKSFKLGSNNYPESQTEDVISHPPALPPHSLIKKKSAGLPTRQSMVQKTPPKPVVYKAPTKPVFKPVANSVNNLNNLTIEELQKKIEHLENEKTKLTTKNRKIQERATQIMVQCANFQSTFDPFVKDFKENLPLLEAHSQEFNTLVQNAEIPEQVIRTNLEKLHQNVSQSLDALNKRMKALTNFYRVCVKEVPHIKINKTDTFQKQINECVDVVEQKKVEENSILNRSSMAPPPPPAAPASPRMKTCVAKYAYAGGHHKLTELLFQPHDVVEILEDETDGSGWMRGRLVNGAEGWFPKSYVKKM